MYHHMGSVCPVGPLGGEGLEHPAGVVLDAAGLAQHVGKSNPRGVAGLALARGPARYAAAASSSRSCLSCTAPMKIAAR